MAEFEVSYKITRKIEGGYSNDPADYGGETFKGISRKAHARWPGWPVVDAFKTSDSEWQSKALANAALSTKVQAFYKERYWDWFRLEQCQDQRVANEIFDTAVNLGRRRAAEYLQRCLNTLRDRGMGYAKLRIDGGPGDVTMRAFSIALDTDAAPELYKMLNSLQGARYIMRANLEGERGRRSRRFVVGWFRHRVYEG